MAEEQHQRNEALDRGAEVRDVPGQPPGRRSSGKCSKNLRLIHRGRNTGLLLIIVEMTNGKCLLSLDVAAPNQITRQTSLAAMTMSRAAEQEAHGEGGVDLAARGQEDHLVAQARHGEEAEDRRGLPHRQHAHLGAELRGSGRCRRRTGPPPASPAARRTAARRPACGVTLGQRDPVGPWW